MNGSTLKVLCLDFESGIPDFRLFFCVDKEVDVVFFVLDTKLKTTAAGPG